VAARELYIDSSKQATLEIVNRKLHTNIKQYVAYMVHGLSYTDLFHVAIIGCFACLVELFPA